MTAELPIQVSDSIPSTLRQMGKGGNGRRHKTNPTSQVCSEQSLAQGRGCVPAGGIFERVPPSLLMTFPPTDRAAELGTGRGEG